MQLARYLYLTSYRVDKRVSEITPSIQSIIIGTFFMDDPSKQSILVELGAVDALGKSKTTLYLEDESGRIEVVLGEQISDIIVSGMIIGIMGIEVSGRFLAAKVFQCGAPPTTSTHNAVGSTHRSILLFSDVDFQSMKWSLLVENFENLIVS